MRLVLRVLLPAALAFGRIAAACAGQAPAAPPRPVALLVGEDAPTESLVAAELGRVLPNLKIIRALPEDRARAELASLDRLPGVALVALGRTRAALAIEAPPRVRLVLGGDLGADSGAALAARRATTSAAPVVRLPLRTPVDEIRGLLSVLGLGAQRIGAIVPESRLPRAESDFPPATLLSAIGSGRTAADAVKMLGSTVSAIIIPDDAELVPFVAAILESSERLRIPVIALSPFLAESGAPFGVIPDVLVAARALAGAALGADDAPEGTVMPTACQRTLDLGAMSRAGLELPARTVAGFDVFRKGLAGGLR